MPGGIGAQAIINRAWLLLNPPSHQGIETAEFGTSPTDWIAGAAVRFAMPRAVTTPPVPTGQIHHPISTKIARELEKHLTLKGHYQPRDPRLTTRAIDEAAHKGYQQWHRYLDDEVIQWLRKPENKFATPEQFETWLRWRYSQPDLLKRFPNGL